MRLNNTIQQDEESLTGILRQSFPVLVAAFYLTLSIIRPWEQLFPAMMIIPFERCYVLFMISVTIATRSKNSLPTSWQTVTVVFFLVSLLVCGLLAQKPDLAWDEIYTFFPAIIFYFVLLSVVRNPQHLMIVIIVYVATMTIYLWKAEWEFFVYGQHRYDMGVIRMVGIEYTYGGPNDLGMSVNASLPFGLLLWKQKEAISASWRKVWQKRFRYGLLLYGLLAVSSIVLTNSRSSMLGLIVFVLLGILGGKGFGRKVGYLAGGICILALIWTLMPVENQGRLRTVWAPEEGPSNAQASADGRVEGFKAGMEMYRRFPFAGVGPGNFGDYRAPNIDGLSMQAHNLVGQLLGELGTVGGAAFLLLITATLGNCRAIKRSAIGAQQGPLPVLSEVAVACRNSLLLLLFLGTFGHNLYRYNWLWLAAFSVLARHFAAELQASKRK